MTLSEKSAYLKGLMEGMNLNTESNEGKMIAAIVDLLMATAMTGEGTSYPDLTYDAEQKLTTEEYGIGCRKGSDLAAFINNVLA